MELHDYYKTLETDQELAEAAQQPTRADKFREELSAKANPAESLMYLGEKQQEVSQELSVVEQMIKDVVAGVTGALSSLVDRFGSNHFGICSFKMPSGRVDKDGNLLDEEGNIIEYYGVKEILNEEMRKRLIRDFEIAMLYLPHIKMQEMRSADKKDIFLVTGITSSEFNAILGAHRTRERLSQELGMIGQEKERLMQNMGLNTATPIRSDGNRHLESVMATPAAEPESKAASRDY